MNKLVLSLLFSLFAFFMQAQSATPMADAFREDGKIYVVISVISIIFLAMVAFLIYIERKLTYLENKIKNKQN